MFVHSLVRISNENGSGWCAPVELGANAPQFISFVIPLNSASGLDSTYACEVVKRESRQERTILSAEMTKVGSDRLVLNVNGQELWFCIRRVSSRDRRLPYIGKLRHPDFELLFVEIEPEEQSQLDQMCETSGLFVIGCDPFQHYQGIEELNGKNAKNTSIQIADKEHIAAQ